MIFARILRNTVWTVFSILILLSLIEGQIILPTPVSNSTNIYNSPSCLERPFSCPHPKIKFFLYTRTTQLLGEQLDVLDRDSLYKTHWNPKHKVKILIHGFNGGRNYKPMPNIRTGYFAVGDYNIIVVDFGESVREPCLSQIDWSPQFAAVCTAQLLRYLGRHKFGVRPESVHIVGFSMGVHIAGLVSNHLTVQDGKIGRITGLDPSIVFEGRQNLTDRLDKSDAHFVDVVHTSAGTVGQWTPAGHVDFYMNGGTRQRNCLNSLFFESFGCNHNIAPDYFVESIISSTGFWGAPCPTLVSYILGLCKPKDYQYMLMGEHASYTTRGIYYVTTNAVSPYAQGIPVRNADLPEHRRGN